MNAATDGDSRSRDELSDVLVIGGGAAGLAAVIFAARFARHLRVRCVDGARHIGAKILVSGGSRCNVTNRIVTEADFWGGSSHTVKRVLRAFPAADAAAFFEEIGVALHEEEDGKLFPDSNRSRTVLDALLAEVSRVGAVIEGGTRVSDVRKTANGFLAATESSREYRVRRVVLATGGRSLPKTGSDGLGYQIARGLGHGYVETTPALAPLVLDGDRHQRLTGVSHRVALTLRAGNGKRTSLEGALLWTHFGASGPVVLNMSRHWHRAQLDAGAATISVNACPGETFETLDSWLLEEQRTRPRARAQTIVAARVPSAVAELWTETAGIDRDTTMAHLSRDDRRRLVQALLETTLVVRDSRGYAYAEVTAGGVPLEEIDPSTMESRVCPGLHIIGEMLDVDGRLGGFNFQWAWSTGWLAGRALARALSD